MWFDSLFLSGLSGLICGFLFSQLLIFGYFTSWQPLPAVPVHVSQLIGLDGQRLFIRSTDGTILSCYPSADDCWQTDTAPVPKNDPFSQVLPSCQLLPSMRILTARPPRIQECIQGKGHYGDGYADYAFILDPNNQVWGWYHDMSARFEFMIVPVLSIIGTILGMLLGGIVAWHHNSKARYLQVSTENDIQKP